MKTVWHWKEVGKAVLGLIVGSIAITSAAVWLGVGGFSFLLGCVWGLIWGNIALARWEMYHFE